jgi:hypothetical protein
VITIEKEAHFWETTIYLLIAITFVLLLIQ